MFIRFIENLQSILTAMDRVQFLTISGSIGLLILIVVLIQKRLLKESHSLLWMFLGFLFLAISIGRPAFGIFAGMVGIKYAPAAVMLFLIIALFLLLIQASVLISKLSDMIKIMAQDMGIYKAKIFELEQRVAGIGENEDNDANLS